MHPRAIEFGDRCQLEFDFKPTVEELPEGTRTAADAADAIGCQLKQIVKSMVMDVGDRLILVLTSGPARIDEHALADHLGIDAVDVSPADPDIVSNRLGWSIGGVPPFAHDEPVETLIDPVLLDQDEVWAGAGTPYAVFPIDPTRLQELTGATTVNVFERD